jgi:hypothetical protein
MAPPHISVIVRTYRRPERLAEALASLACQTFRRFEVVVVDMDAAQNLPRIDQFRPALPHLEHRKLNGPLSRPRALNYGIDHASGSVVCVLDDDNRYEPVHLATLADGLSRTGSDLVYTGVRRETYTPQGALIHSDQFGPTPFDHGRLILENFIYATSMAMHKNLWRRAGRYDERFPIYEDWEFLIRAGMAGRLEAIPGFSAVTRSFTGSPGMAEHRLDEAECRRCHVGLMWVHRGLRRRVLRERSDLVSDPADTLPPHGVRREHLPLLREWWSRAERAGVGAQAQLTVANE